MRLLEYSLERQTRHVRNAATNAEVGVSSWTGARNTCFDDDDDQANESFGIGLKEGEFLYGGLLRLGNMRMLTMTCAP